MAHQAGWLRVGVRTIVLGLGLASAAILPACQAAGYVARLAVGDVATPAQYVLQQRPLVVVVHDQPDPSGEKIESESVAGEIDKELTTHALAPLVASTSVAELRANRPVEFASMSPVQIARAVGADQVLDVKIIQSSVAPDGYTEMYRGKITAMIRVYDATTGELLWPADQQIGKPMSFGTPMMRASDSVNRSSVQRIICAGLAKGIVKQFRTYKAEE